MPDAADLSEAVVDSRQSALRARIALVCHVVRWLTVGYLLFAAWALWAYWTDAEQVRRVFLEFYKLDIAGAADWQWRVARFIAAADLLMLACLCWNIWRLFGRYLAGAIFTLQSAALLQRIGILGLATIAFDFATRSVTVYVMASHLGGAADLRHVLLRVDDVLYVLVSLFLVALGMIYRSAAELADEHAQIV